MQTLKWLIPRPRGNSTTQYRSYQLSNIQWPSPSDYDWALQHRQTTFYDPVIRNGALQELAGRPARLNGGGSKYVCVYRVDDWILRCFTAQPPNVRPPAGIIERYRSIIPYLQCSQHNPPFLVMHTLVANGININGKDVPYLKIPYIKDSRPLGDFLIDHRYDSEFGAIANELAKKWLDIVKQLEADQVAHGDLDMTNILVCGTWPTISLQLIDFDGMYVPDLAKYSLGVADNGHAHFQPANASLRTFGPTMDRFSSLIIYLSLCALAKNPFLWENCEAEENRFLLGAEDFSRLSLSKNFVLLRKESDNIDLQKCLDELQWSGENEQMPRSLVEILDGQFVKPEPIPISPRFPPIPVQRSLPSATKPLQDLIFILILGILIVLIIAGLVILTRLITHQPIPFLTASWSHFSLLHMPFSENVYWQVTA